MRARARRVSLRHRRPRGSAADAMELDFELSVPASRPCQSHSDNNFFPPALRCVRVCPCRRRCLRGLPMLSTFHNFVFKGLNQVHIQMDLVF